MWVNKLTCSTSHKPISNHSLSISPGPFSRAEKRPLQRGIKDARDVPDDSCIGLPAIKVPDGRSNRAAGADDAAHFLDRLSGFGDELQHQQRKGPIEPRIRVGQGTRVAHVEGE